ncbi:MAG: carboxylating nicotinate-nucleotide diphosphorylase [Prevotellaceae bacterium]|jgi:nicotinate-nucleotide pyrophosphorylase (carboxylating)|nr:carboxylating nicotinate-nucleotide diphosphorylase [Prevotellaceae bacterium]
MKIDPAFFTDNIIDLAIREDVGDGDHTSLACIPPDATGKMQLLAKQAGIVAGVEVARRIFQKLDSSTTMEQFIADGAHIKPGDVVFYVTGKIISLLQAERLALNFMQRLSGIATQTAVYAAALEGLKAKVIDTRKTTPGMRVLEKMAVALGGGSNHRMGLHDMILIKDNHVDFSGGIEQAVRNAQAYLKKTGLALQIEVEVRSLADVEKALAVGGVDRIMLDNFSLQDTKVAVEMIGGRYEVESSGGITLATLRPYAECGVDYISVGALTHQIKSLDLSLKAVSAPNFE